MMRSGNPALRDDVFTGVRSHDPLNVMTIQGTVNKTMILLGLTILTAIWAWSHVSVAVPFLMPAAIVGLILAVVTIGGIILSPLIVRVIAPGFGGMGEKYALTVFLTRIMFPYIFLVSLLALFMGILNSLKHFAAPAMAPVFVPDPPVDVATEEKLLMTRRERNCLVSSSSVVIAFRTTFRVSSSAVGRTISKLINGLRRFPSMIR